MGVRSSFSSLLSYLSRPLGGGEPEFRCRPAQGFQVGGPGHNLGQELPKDRIYCLSQSSPVGMYEEISHSQCLQCCSSVPWPCKQSEKRSGLSMQRVARAHHLTKNPPPQRSVCVHTHIFSKFENYFFSVDVVQEVGVMFPSSIILFCEGNLIIVLRETQSAKLVPQSQGRLQCSRRCFFWFNTTWFPRLKPDSPNSWLREPPTAPK